MTWRTGRRAIAAAATPIIHSIIAWASCRGTSAAASTVQVGRSKGHAIHSGPQLRTRRTLLDSWAWLGTTEGRLGLVAVFWGTKFCRNFLRLGTPSGFEKRKSPEQNPVYSPAVGLVNQGGGGGTTLLTHRTVPTRTASRPRPRRLRALGWLPLLGSGVQPSPGSSSASLALAASSRNRNSSVSPWSLHMC